MDPYLYVENNRPIEPIHGKVIPASEPRRHGGDGFWRGGQIADGFRHSEILPRISDKAVSYIRAHAATSPRKPFFLYFALTAPHAPWLPTDTFKGRSTAGPYGDFVAQVDDVVGKVVSALNETGASRNTLLIVTSDNGAHWLPSDIQQYGHLANGPLRGQKADIFEGGHRVPFIATWPTRIKGGQIGSQPMTLADLMATIAAIVGVSLGADAGPDSFDISSQLFQGDDSDPIPRAPLIHHSFDGMYAIRQGDWKLIEGLGSGGFTQPARLGEGTEFAYQLYHLGKDPGESSNVAAKYPSIVEDLARQLDEIRDAAFSRGSL